MNAGEMEKLAKNAAKEAVSETFLTLGMDVSNPISVQGQFAVLRNLHYAARHARNVIIAGVLGALVSGGAWAFWMALKRVWRRRRSCLPPAEDDACNHKSDHHSRTRNNPRQVLTFTGCHSALRCPVPFRRNLRTGILSPRL
jgi:hypothetical protein